MGLFAVMMLFSVPAIVYLVWSTMASGIASVSILMQWGLVGEAIDYNELLTGKRTEGSIYGTFNLSRRIGQTVGNSAAVLALGWIGYDANLAAQSAGTLTGIKALCVLVPGIFLVGSWIAFRFVWNITPEIRAKMAASKAAKSAQ
ncbi:MAG: MFS transporter [Ruthenibacterium lactatiformans]